MTLADLPVPAYRNLLQTLIGLMLEQANCKAPR
jgi:hypothetical protein